MSTLPTLCNYLKTRLILAKSSKSKNQVVHEQKFKDLQSSTCQVSVERRVLNLQSEVQGFNTHWGNILILEIFVFYEVKPRCQYWHHCQHCLITKKLKWLECAL